VSHPSHTSLPPEVEEVFREFRTCEWTTLARDGSPMTWPTLPFWRPDEGHFLITTSSGLPHKAFHIRCDPQARCFSPIRRPRTPLEAEVDLGE